MTPAIKMFRTMVSLCASRESRASSPESVRHANGRRRNPASLRALLQQERNDRFVLEVGGAVKRGPAVDVGRVDVDAKFDGQLDGLQGQPFALAPRQLHPRAPAAYT